jgi:hypothetical protein
MPFIKKTVIACILFLPTLVFADIQDMEKDLQQRIAKFHSFAEYTGNTLVKASTDSAFQEYFLSNDPVEKGRLKHKIDFLSQNTQAKFKVDEMCLIDAKGQEISRIVYEQVAPNSELSAEEASAPFFNPAFALDKGEFHVSAPYVSADSLRWVICFVTPIVLPDGSKPGIYHYEMSLYVFQGILNQKLTAASDEILLVVNKDGYVMSDSRETFALEFNVADSEMKTPLSDYFPKLSDSAPGLTDLKGSGDVSIKGRNYTFMTKDLGYNDWQAILLYPK